MYNSYTAACVLQFLFPYIISLGLNKLQLLSIKGFLCSEINRCSGPNLEAVVFWKSRLCLIIVSYHCSIHAAQERDAWDYITKVALLSCVVP